MALGDLSLLDAAQFTAGLKAASAKVKAEFLNIITRLNAVKDIAEQNASDIGAAETDIDALQSRMGVAEGDIANLEDEVSAYVGHRTPHDILLWTGGNMTFDATLMLEYSILVLNSAGADITLGAPTSLDTGREFIVFNAGMTTAGARGALKIYNSLGFQDGTIYQLEYGATFRLTVIMVGTTKYWQISGLNDLRPAAQYEPFETSSATPLTATWDTPKAIRVTANSGVGILYLPEITSYYVGREIEVIVVDGGDTCRLSVPGSPTVAQRIGDDTTTYIDLLRGDHIVLRAGPACSFAGSPTSRFIWFIVAQSS